MCMMWGLRSGSNASDAMNGNAAPAQASSKSASGNNDSRPYMCKNYTDKFMSNLNALRKSGKCCDVELVSGNVSIKAHKLVLSSGSAYFEAMFSSGLAEEHRSTVSLPGIPPVALPIIIDFIYMGKVILSRETVQEVLSAADMLQLRDLVAGCQEFLDRELHPSNAVGIYMFAEAHNCNDLANAAIEHIAGHFPAVSSGDEFLQLSPTLIARLLNSDELKVDSEAQVLEAALRWVEHNPGDRRRYVFEVLSAVRLALIGPSALDRALQQCTDSSLQVALRNHKMDLKYRRGALVNLDVTPRMRARRRVLLLGGSCREPPMKAQRATDTIFNSVLQFDLLGGNKWKEVCSMSTGRILPGVASLGGRVYAVGGEQGSHILADGEVYDPTTDTWSPVPPMNVARCEFGLTAWRGTLYALGGWVGEDIGASMECYDPHSQQWTSEGDMPEPRFSMGVVTYDGLIYVVGGCTHAERHLCSLLSYNPAIAEWQTLAPMRTARSQAGIAVLDGFLYVVGGNSKSQEVLSSVEKYSFDEDKWYSVCCMTVGRASPTVVAVEDRLLVCGGDQPHEEDAFYRARASTASTELYDPHRDLWYAGPLLPQPRSEAGGAVILS